MPDPSNTIRRQVDSPPPYHPAATGYVELHCKTNFSFLEGASHPDELVQRAAELGYRGLAITDRNSLAGVVRAYGAAKQLPGFKLLVGAEITPVDAPPVVMLATDRAAYSRLCRLITLGRRSASKGECHLSLDQVSGHSEGLIACALSDTSLEPLEQYREIFGDRCYLLGQLHYGPDDERRLEMLVQKSKQAGVPLVASNGALFHGSDRKPLADVLTAIRVGKPVSEIGDLLLPNGERYLKTPEQMKSLFFRVPATLRRTVEIAQRCSFCLSELRYDYPVELSPPGQTALEYLTELTWQGAHKRYPAGITTKVRALLKKELQVIEQLQYEAYFFSSTFLISSFG